MTTTNELLQILQDECAIAEAWPDERRKLDRSIEKNVRAACALAECKYEFERGDFLSLVTATSLAYELGFTIPFWAYKHIAEAFEKYEEDGCKNGSAKIDVLLGLSDKQPFTKSNKLGQYDKICGKIVTLNRLIGFSLPIAYRIVKINEANHISIHQIEDIYKTHGKHARNLPLSMLSFSFDSLEALSIYLLADNQEFKDELFEAGLLKSYMKTLNKFCKEFVPGKPYGGVPGGPGWIIL
jgi:hypothetical protein